MGVNARSRSRLSCAMTWILFQGGGAVMTVDLGGGVVMTVDLESEQGGKQGEGNCGVI
jgi:hypothetical protein